MDLCSTEEDPTNGGLTDQGDSPLTIRGMILQVGSQYISVVQAHAQLTQR